jgi:hypothetical protein
MERSRPMRSATTVAATYEPQILELLRDCPDMAAQCPALGMTRMVLWATPNLAGEAFTPIPYARWSRWISAQSSTLITLLTPWFAPGQGSSPITASGGPGRRGSIFGCR